MKNTHILFEYQGNTYKYTGGLPDDIIALPAVAALFDADGFWIGGYPDSLDEEQVDPRDCYPTARWEIEKIGGRILVVVGARPDGAIFEEDWEALRLY